MDQGTQSFSVYVQIASYRDLDVENTLRDCFVKAKHPERVFVGVCLQGDDINFNHENIRWYKCHWIDSKGCAWARWVTHRLYNGEDYTLQIDSHSRFAQNWDEILIEDHQALGDDKAILSSYPPGFRFGPDGEEILDSVPDSGTALCLERFNFDAYPRFRVCHGASKARFVAGGMIFARGHLIQKVPSDPKGFFLEEEILLSVRYFTSGYNLYGMKRMPIYHLYHASIDKEKRVGDRILNSDNEAQNNAIARLHQMIFGRHQVNLGTVRTLDEYEAYAGIDFVKKRVHPTVYGEKCEEPLLEKYRAWLSQSDGLSCKTVLYVDLLPPDSDDFRLTFFGDFNRILGTIVPSGEIEVQIAKSGQITIQTNGNCALVECSNGSGWSKLKIIANLPTEDLIDPATMMRSSDGLSFLFGV